MVTIIVAAILDRFCTAVTCRTSGLRATGLYRSGLGGVQALSSSKRLIPTAEGPSEGQSLDRRGHSGRTGHGHGSLPQRLTPGFLDGDVQATDFGGQILSSHLRMTARKPSVTLRICGALYPPRGFGQTEPGILGRHFSVDNQNGSIGGR